MLKSLRLGTKLISVFLVIGLLPLGIVGVISLSRTKAALRSKALEQVETIRNLKKGEIEAYFRERLADIRLLAANPTVMDAMAAFEGGYKMGVLSSEYRGADKVYSPWLTQFEKSSGYADLYLIGPEGDIVYAAQKKPDFASNLVNGKYSGESLADLFRKVRSGATVTDFRSYAPAKGAAASFIGAPIDDAVRMKV